MLKINKNFSAQYIEALTIVYEQDKKVWECFIRNVPLFKDVNCRKDIKIIARIVHQKFYNIIDFSKRKYEKWWSEEKYDVERVLEKLFQIKISKVIKAQVCITPLFTRNIIKKEFLIPTNSNKHRFYNIVTHELIHYYYYYKLKNTNIVIDEEMAWMISELIVYPIIEYFFPDYIYLNNKYDFNNNQKKIANYLIKLFISKKIDFNELVRRMQYECANKSNK